MHEMCAAALNTCNMLPQLVVVCLCKQLKLNQYNLPTSGTQVHSSCTSCICSDGQAAQCILICKHRYAPDVTGLSYSACSARTACSCHPARSCVVQCVGLMAMSLFTMLQMRTFLLKDKLWSSHRLHGFALVCTGAAWHVPNNATPS